MWIIVVDNYGLYFVESGCQSWGFDAELQIVGIQSSGTTQLLRVSSCHRQVYPALASDRATMMSGCCIPIYYLISPTGCRMTWTKNSTLDLLVGSSDSKQQFGKMESTHPFMDSLPSNDPRYSLRLAILEWCLCSGADLPSYQLGQYSFDPSAVQHQWVQTSRTVALHGGNALLLRGYSDCYQIAESWILREFWVNPRFRKP